MLEIKIRHLTWGGPRYACNIFVLWQVYGEFGWDCKLGKCDLMANNHDFSTLKKIPPGFIMDLVAFIIPFMLIFVSYFYIWFYMWKSRKFFKSHGTRYILYGIFYANLLFWKNYLKWVDFFKKYIYLQFQFNQSNFEQKWNQGNIYVISSLLFFHLIGVSNDSSWCIVRSFQIWKKGIQQLNTFGSVFPVLASIQFEFFHLCSRMSAIQKGLCIFLYWGLYIGRS